jgi:hypothetical protein
MQMRAPTAAAYCDETSVAAFLSKVRKGVYPAPSKNRGLLRIWHRYRLDEAIAHLHNLRIKPAPIAETIEDLI